MESTVTHAELLASGLSANNIAVLATRGDLHRLRRGVYTHEVSGEARDRHVALAAATLKVVDPGNVLSHTTAAIIHGLPVRKGVLEHVTMIRRTSGHGDRGPHLRVRNTRLGPGECTVLDGMPVTTLARTVSDVARTEPMMWGIVAADAALAADLSRKELAAAIEVHRRLHGVKRARDVARLASPLSESPAESLSRINMLHAGLPRPEEQVEIYDDDGVFIARVDFLWREQWLVGECDGDGKYGALLAPGQTAQDVIVEEKRREAALRALGFNVVRWGWQTALHPASLARVIGPELAGATRSRHGFARPTVGFGIDGY